MPLLIWFLVHACAGGGGCPNLVVIFQEQSKQAGQRHKKPTHTHTHTYTLSPLQHGTWKRYPLRRGVRNADPGTRRQTSTRKTFCSPCAPVEACRWILLSFLFGTFGGNLAGSFLDPHIKAHKFQKHFGAIFQMKIRTLTFWASHTRKCGVTATWCNCNFATWRNCNVATCYARDGPWSRSKARTILVKLDESLSLRVPLALRKCWPPRTPETPRNWRSLRSD